MALRSTGAGLFTIPTAPSIGVTVASPTSASAYSTAYVQLIASVAAGGAYITGIDLSLASTAAIGYCNVQIGVGAAGSEVTVGQIQADIGLSAPSFTGGKQGSFATINPWIAVSSGSRIAAKTADDIASALSWNVSLQCIAITNVVDAGLNESANVVQFGGTAVTGRDLGASVLLSSGTGTGQLSLAAGLVTLAGVTHTGAVIPTVTALTNAPTAGDFTSTMKASLNAATPASVTGAVGSVTAAVTLPSIPAGWITAAGISSGALSTQAIQSVSSAVASVTNAVVLPSIPANWITSSGIAAAAMNGKGDWLTSAGTLATVTNLTNLPSIPANWITAAGINASALNGKGDWNIGKTGYSLTQTFPSNFSLMSLSTLGAVTAGTIGDKTGYSLTLQDWAKAGDAMTLTSTYAAAKTALTSTAYVAPDNASVAAIKLQTDALSFTVTGKLDANIYYVNGHAVTGDGKSGTEWGPL